MDKQKKDKIGQEWTEKIKERTWNQMKGEDNLSFCPVGSPILPHYGISLRSKEFFIE